VPNAGLLTRVLHTSRCSSVKLLLVFVLVARPSCPDYRWGPSDQGELQAETGERRDWSAHCQELQPRKENRQHLSIRAVDKHSNLRVASAASGRVFLRHIAASRSHFETAPRCL
jgi:hypothetical protein